MLIYIKYLLVWEGQNVDEARWVPSTTLTSPSALLRIEDFEAEELLVSQFQGSEEEDSTGSEDTDDELDDDGKLSNGIGVAAH